MTGWSCKDAAQVLDVSPTKVSQATGPAFIKVAKLMLADPQRTMAELLSTMNDLNRDHRAFESPEERMRP
ncbi:MAG: hypothetical protein ACREJC_04220 [Tepidisphaeraceae bacterium]